jgi:hypothetical protein
MVGCPIAGRLTDSGPLSAGRCESQDLQVEALIELGSTVRLLIIRPYLLIDVDGVLNPVGTSRAPDGFARHELLGYDVWLSPRHGLWLNELATWFDLVWATTWEHDAPRLIAPILKLPSDLPVIEFRQSEGETWKLRDVARFAGKRPLAWIDDDLFGDAFVWAEQRKAPTLLIRILARVGLTEQEVWRLQSFGRSITDPDE